MELRKQTNRRALQTLYFKTVDLISALRQFVYRKD